MLTGGGIWGSLVLPDLYSKIGATLQTPDANTSKSPSPLKGINNE